MKAENVKGRFVHGLISSNSSALCDDKLTKDKSPCVPVHTYDNCKLLSVMVWHLYQLKHKVT